MLQSLRGTEAAMGAAPQREGRLAIREAAGRSKGSLPQAQPAAALPELPSRGSVEPAKERASVVP
ncbi:MAG: hypothetical protein AAFQ81_18905, partial [Pseudomonadota bacterium]